MRNVGRYPDRDTSLAHLKLAEDRVAEVSMTPAEVNAQIDSRIMSYVTPAQVDSEAGKKLSKSALNVDANRYISSSEVGTNYASLVNNRIPTGQLPSHPSATRLETSYQQLNGTSMGTVRTYGSEVRAGGFTISDPNYAWIPIIWGDVEVQTRSGATPAVVVVRDSSGRMVAGGVSSRGHTFNRVSISPEGISTSYIGTHSFSIYLSARDGGSSFSITSFERALFIMPAPWTP